MLVDRFGVFHAFVPAALNHRHQLPAPHRTAPTEQFHALSADRAGPPLWQRNPTSFFNLLNPKSNFGISNEKLKRVRPRAFAIKCPSGVPMLQLMSLVLLIYSYFITRITIPTLPQRIPVHFNAAGEANGWGSPDIFWLLFAAQTLSTVLFLAVPYLGQLLPGAVHFGRRRLSDFSPERRPQMLSIMSDMSAYMSIVMNLFFVVMLHEMIRAVREPIPRLHPLFPLGLMIAGMVGVMVYYFWKFNAAAKKSDGIESPPQLPS